MTLAVIAFAFSSYIILDFDQFIYRAGFPNIRDYVLGSFAILLVLEGTRRSLGVPLAVLGLFALAICYLGPYLANVPVLNFFSHRGFPFPHHRPDVPWNRGALRGPPGGCGDLRFPFRPLWHLHHEDRPGKVLY